MRFNNISEFEIWLKKNMETEEEFIVVSKQMENTDILLITILGKIKEN